MIQVKVDSESFTEWLNWTPFLYSYLSIHTLQQYDGISNVRWSKMDVKNSSIKFLSKVIYTCGYAIDNHGLLSVNEIVMPLTTKDLDDKRCTPSLKKIQEIQTNSQVKKLEEFKANSYQKPLLAITTLQKYISVYDSTNIRQGEIIKCHGHTSYITCIKSNPNYLASADGEANILIWDLQSLKQKPSQSFKQHKKSVNDIAWITSSSNTFISASSDTNVILWDVRTQQPTNKIPSNFEVNSVCAFNQYIFLSGGNQGTIKFWDIRKNKSFAYRQHQQSINSIKITSKNTQSFNDLKNQNLNLSFMTASDDSKVVLWTDKIQFVHHGHQSPVFGADYDIQNKNYITADGRSNKIMIWKP